MTVSEIRHIISEYRDGFNTYDAGTYPDRIFKAYNRARVPDAEFLLNLLQVIYGTYGKSADGLFLELMSYKTPTFDKWNANEFKGSRHTAKQSELLCELYRYVVSEESANLCSRLDINCYTNCNIVTVTSYNNTEYYCMILSYKRFVWISRVELNYIRYMYGSTFVTNLKKPLNTRDTKLLNCLDYVLHIKGIQDPITVDDLAKVAPEKYIPLELPNAINYTVERSGRLWLINIYYDGTQSELNASKKILQSDIGAIIKHDTLFEEPVFCYGVSAISLNEQRKLLTIGVNHI